MSNVLYSSRDVRATTERLSAALTAVRKQWRGTAEIGLILGTGCGDVAESIDAEAVIPYHAVPHLPRSTALAHKGQFVCGTLRGTPVIAMQGRCHLYEGYGFDEVTLGVRIMHAVGARRLLLSNAAGGLNPAHATGDIVLVTGHVNLMWRYRTGVRRGTPSGPGRRGATIYDPALIDHAAAVARRENFPAHRGVYVAVSGPNYETRAEYRFFRRLGDVVGMSTVPEALVATECGMRVMALSLVTNVARPDAPERVDAEDVVVAARRAEPNLRKIVLSVVSEANRRGGGEFSS